MLLDLTDEGIDYKAEKYRKMLANLQGNILKGHGRDHSVHLFLRFTARPRMVRDWVRIFAYQHVTPAIQQLKEVEEFNTHCLPGELFGNFFLSAKGYEALGYSRGEIARRFEEKPAVIDGREVVTIKFCDGMEAYRGELNDPDPATWEKAYQGRQIHAMILLADDDEGFLLRQARAVFKDVITVADVLAVEHGRVLRNSEDESIEHFGYVDGRSQPLFLQTDIASEIQNIGIDLQTYIKAKLKKIDIVKWDPAAPLGLVLVPDPNVSNAEDCFGSYFVFRKLEQNVRGFKEEEEKLAGTLDLTEKLQERAGALIVGRFEDGTPVTSEAKQKKARHVPNDFNYDDDRDASKCPFHAHIRKVNPRGDTGNVEEERMHRIARRGITYGQRKPTFEDRPEKGVGLLFMCFQSSLANQFGFLQKMYANSPAFPRADTGLDPVIGQGRMAMSPIEQHWPRQWGMAGRKRFPFGGFVALKGGEFFFTPSIPFLKGL